MTQALESSQGERIMRTSILAREGFRAALLVCGLALSFVQAGAQEADDKKIQRRLVVNGMGEVKIKPDKAEITIGVVTENKSSQVAAKANAQATTAVMSAVKRLGIPDKDLQTANYSIQPLVDGGVPGPRGERKPQIVGYRVYNQVRVTVRKLEMISDVLDGATAAGSNTIDGIAFGVEDDRASTDEAIEKAIADARRKAERIARAAGATILGVYEINEGGIGRPVPMMMMRGGFGGAADAAVSTPIQAGELTVTANVNIVYQISPTLKAAQVPAKKTTAARR